MSNPSSYQKRKAEKENVLTLVEQIRAESDSSDEALRRITKAISGIPGGAQLLTEVYADVVKANRHDVGAKILSAFMRPSTGEAHIPPQNVETTKAVKSGDLQAAIAGAFGVGPQATRKATKTTTIASADGPRHGELPSKRSKA